MKFQKPTARMFDFIFILALFCTFSASAFLSVIIGANVYKRTTQNMEMNYARRTGIAYITEKIRYNDTEDSVSLTTIDGTQCLVLNSPSGKNDYQIYIYCYNGFLMELFIKNTNTPNLASGETIMEVNHFSMIKIKSGLYQLTIENTDGSSQSTYLSVRSDMDREEETP